MDILSVVITLLSLVALTSPVWLYFLVDSSCEEDAEELLTNQQVTFDDVVDYILDLTDETKLEELLLYVGSRRILLHTYLFGERIRIV